MITTRLRAVKVDENEAQQKTKKATTNLPKTGTTNGVTKRAALGELGNRAAVKTSDLKDGVNALKITKARVDTHWKKTDILQNAANRVVGVKVPKVPTASAKPGNEVKTLKPKVTVKQTKSVDEKQTQQPTLQQNVAAIRREESNVSRRSLSKLKAALCKDKKEKALPVAAVAPLTASVSAPAAIPPAIVNVSAAPPRPIEVKCKIKAHSSSLLDEVENIDAGDTKNPLLVSEYANDIYSYLFQLELEMPIRKTHLDKQTEVTPKMRAVLFDWINEVHFQFRLLPETYHLTISIIDRYLQEVSTTQRQHLQLVGIGALFLASKYEELYPPEISDFVYIADDTYTKGQILSIEQKIIQSIGFNLGRPSSIHFLRRFSKAASTIEETHMMAKYLIELVSIEYSLAHHRPSEVAAASLFLALKLLNKNRSATDDQLWTNTLKFYSTYTLENLQPLVKKIAVLLKNAPKAQLKAVYNKYQSSKFDKIAVKSELRGALLDEIISSE